MQRSFRQPRSQSNGASSHNNYAPSMALSSLAASTIRSALSNPYASTYSSHYAHAYQQQNFPAAQYTTPEGFTFSSTYNPAASTSNNSSINLSSSSRVSHNYAASSSWYQPGTSRCTYKQCTFTGSAKSVEIHMADRHLVYPPGWGKRNKGSDWDADPSLKGKTIPIQGTNVVLDTPDAIEAWIAERKKRFPTTASIQDKKRKREEASARGELSVEALGLFSKKRRPHESGDEAGHRGRGRGRGRGMGRGLDAGRSGTNMPQNQNRVHHPLPQKPSAAVIERAKESDPVKAPVTVMELQLRSDDSDDDDGPPESMSSRIVEESVSVVPTVEETRIEESKVAAQSMAPSKPARHRPPQPKAPSHNPFGPKSSLLRNLLLPEIRITASNLSQAIRFIVDNDFFEGVELKPGQAAEKKIEIVDDSVDANS